MTSSLLVDGVKIVVNSTGTGALALGSAVPSFRGIEALINGSQYSYAIQIDGDFEWGTGTYLATSQTLTRSPIWSSNGGAPIDLSANAQVSFVALAEDLYGPAYATAAQAAAEQAAADRAQADQDAQQTGEDRAAVEAAVATVATDIPYPPAYATALPQGVTSLSTAGIGTGSGGTPGTYAGGVSGGPAGFAWSYTIGSDGKIASYAIINKGIGTTNAAPTLSYPSGGITGATVPTATVAVLIAPGQSYWVASSDGQSIYLYANSGGSVVTSPIGGTQLVQGAAVLQPIADIAEAWAQSPTNPDPSDPNSKSAKTIATELESLITDIDLDSDQAIPIFQDDAGNVIIRAQGPEGGISFDALGPDGTSAVLVALEPLGAVPYQIEVDATAIPRTIDDNGNVPDWYEGENGGFACTALSASLIGQINAQVQGRQYPFGRNAPVSTDGRLLYQYRSKLGLLASGAVVQPTILMLGDSYVGLPNLPQAIATSSYTAHGKSSDGWLSTYQPNSINGITRTVVGTWTPYDAKNGVAPTNGCGIDGQAYSATGNAQRDVFMGIKCTEFTIWYYDGLGGSIEFIRYASDGVTVEATTPLVFGGTNTVKSHTFAGQPDQLRTYEINTSNNTGTSYICGYRATRNSAAGIIIDKCGDPGAVSNNLTLFSSQLVNYQAMAPDVIMLALGTNNASVYSTTAQFESDIPALISSYRALWPNVGIILIAQPLCTGVKQSPLIDYRDAAYEIALSNDCEFYSMFDDWSDFNTMNGLGMFLPDGIHPSVAGSDMTATRITQKLGL